MNGEAEMLSAGAVGEEPSLSLGPGDYPTPRAVPPFLIATRMGPRSLHKHWIEGASRGLFDVLLSCFDPAVVPEAGPGMTVEFRPGKKVEGYAGILRNHADLLERYKYVCFLDEDILASADLLAGCFRLAAAHDLKIAQPALAWGSYFSFAVLLQQPQFLLRHVNFIEMMCPIFRHDVLQKIRPLYEIGLESGIDLIWCNAVYEGPRDFAVLDAFPVLHTEPIGGRSIDNGFADAQGYEDHIQDALRRFGLPRHRPACYDALRLDGRRVSGRLGLAFASLSVFGALLRQPKRRTLVKCGVDMLMHQLFLGACNAKPMTFLAEEKTG